MDFSQDQKTWVAEWIDRQFDTNGLFPCECAAPEQGDPCVCTAHLRAYKTWSSTPRKKRHIRSWIEDWLGDEEKALLQRELASREARQPRLQEV